MRFNTTLDEKPAETIVAAMVHINSSMQAWMSSSLATNGLWFQLARTFILKSDRKYAYRLKIRFDRNRDNLKGLFGEAVGEPCLKIDPPKTSSTPKPRDKICVCRRIYSPSDGSVIGCHKCKDWFHGDCIRTNVTIEAKKRTWLCPRCKGNSLFEYPENWLDSKSFQTDVVSDVTSPSSETKEQHTFLSLETPENNACPAWSDAMDQSLDAACESQVLPPTNRMCGARRKLLFGNTDDKLRTIEANTAPFQPPTTSKPSLKDETCTGHAFVKSWSHEGNAAFQYDTSLKLNDTARSNTSKSKSLSRGKAPMIFTEAMNAVPRTPNCDVKQENVEQQVKLEEPKMPSEERVVNSAEVHENHEDFSDEDCQEVNDFMAARGIDIPPACFKIKIGRAEWEGSLQSQDPPKFKRSWGNMFRDAINPHNRICPFSFEGHEFLKGRLKGKFFRAWGHCKHGRTIKTKSDKPCWAIEINGVKRTKEYLKFEVVCQGDFRHKMGNRESNYITGTRRDKMKDLLRYRKAGKVSAELNRAANMDDIRCGNATNLHGTKVLAQIRHEELSKKDLDQDPFIDIYKRIKMDPKLNSFVRVASAKPLCILMVSDEQLKLLKLMRTTVESLVAHLDATGSIVRKLPLEDKCVFLYAIVVDSPMKGEPPIALGEFLLSDQTRASISFALNSFLRICKKYLNLPSGEPVFKRFETDDSKAIYGAVIEQTTHCKSISEYLEHCWRELFTKQPPLKSNIHLCRAHAMNMLMTQGKKDKYLLGVSGMDKLYPLLKHFVESTTMEEVTFYVRRMFVLCLSQFENSEVVAILRNPHKPMPANYVANYNWTDFLEPAGEDNGSIWCSTAFGRLFIYIQKEVIREIDSFSTSNSMSNVLYSRDFVTYLQKEVLAYTPMFTHVMMAIRGDNSSVDTNDRVERWNREVKVVEGFHNEKLPRYVEDNLASIQGRCVRLEASLHDFVYERRRLQRLACGSSTTPRRPISSAFRRKTTKSAKRCTSGEKQRTPRSAKRSRHSISKATPPKTSDTPKLPSPLNPIPEERSYEHEEQWGKSGAQVAHRTGSVRHFQNLPLLLWGDKATDECSKVFTNTCPLDNFFMILIYAHHNNLAWRRYVSRPRNQLQETFNTLVNFLVEPEPRVNAARLHFLRSILNRNPVETFINLVGDEITSTLEPLRSFSTDYIVNRRCQIHGSNRREVLQVFGVCNMDVMTIVQLINSGGFTKRCPACSQFMENVVEKPQPSAILPIISFGVFSEKNLQNIPVRIPILGDEYELFACSVFQSGDPIGHYRAGFLFRNKWYCFDARTGQVTATTPVHDLVSSCWYRKID